MNKALYFSIVLVVVLIVCGLAYYFFYTPNNDNTYSNNNHISNNDNNNTNDDDNNNDNITGDFVATASSSVDTNREGYYIDLEFTGWESKYLVGDDQIRVGIWVSPSMDGFQGTMPMFLADELIIGDALIRESKVPINTNIPSGVYTITIDIYYQFTVSGPYGSEGPVTRAEYNVITTLDYTTGDNVLTVDLRGGANE